MKIVYLFICKQINICLGPWKLSGNLTLKVMRESLYCHATNTTLEVCH